MRTKKSPSYIQAFIPLIFLIGLLTLNVWFFGDESTGGANQIALLLATMVAAIIGLYNKLSWKDLQGGITKSIHSALPALLILLLIGALSATWMMSGIVPTMIYFGLKILNPTIFLVVACLVCAIVAVATGSSWTTVATVGVALLAIGTSLGLSEGVVAGAIISGAYFGDKMSPLSDTTNLAPAMAGTDLFTHIKYMALTTVPTMILTLLIFTFLGFNAEGTINGSEIDQLLIFLESKFYISPVLFIVPIIVVVLIIKKVDAVPALFIGALLGGVAAIIFQPNMIKAISGESANYAKASYIAIMKNMAIHTELDFQNTGLEKINANDLLSTKGMSGMLGTIWLIICAMSLGGVLEVTGILVKITNGLKVFIRSTGSLIATTVSTCLFFNITASDQYLAIVVPGKMFAETYKKQGLKPQNLSRTLEDSGTVTSVLVPWNTCAAYQTGVLGVATGEYWMYCFFNLISPVMTMVYGFFNIKIARYTREEVEKIELEEAEMAKV